MGVLRILVIDDEPMIAETLQKIFEAAGYDCRAFSSGEEFLATDHAAWSPGFALIDMVLPGMNGIELALLLTARFPALKLHLFTGQTEMTAILQKSEEKGIYFPTLNKPIHPTELLRLVREAIDANSSSQENST